MFTTRVCQVHTVCNPGKFLWIIIFFKKLRGRKIFNLNEKNLCINVSAQSLNTQLLRLSIKSINWLLVYPAKRFSPVAEMYFSTTLRLLLQKKHQKSFPFHLNYSRKCVKKRCILKRIFAWRHYSKISQHHIRGVVGTSAPFSRQRNASRKIV